MRERMPGLPERKQLFQYTPPTTIQVFTAHGKLVGECYKEVDGCYVFQPDKGCTGYWTAEALLEIGSKLVELNRDWDREVNRDLRPR